MDMVTKIAVNSSDPFSLIGDLCSSNRKILIDYAETGLWGSNRQTITSPMWYIGPGSTSFVSSWVMIVFWLCWLAFPGRRPDTNTHKVTFESSFGLLIFDKFAFAVGIYPYHTRGFLAVRLTLEDLHISNLSICQYQSYHTPQTQNIRLPSSLATSNCLEALIYGLIQLCIIRA